MVTSPEALPQSYGRLMGAIKATRFMNPRANVRHWSGAKQALLEHSLGFQECAGRQKVLQVHTNVYLEKLGDYPPTPPLTQNFAPREKSYCQCWFSGGSGGEVGKS